MATRKTSKRNTATINPESEPVSLLSLRQAAARLGISDWTLRRWALQGKIASVTLGRRRLIPDSVVRDLIDRNMHAASCSDELKL